MGNLMVGLLWAMSTAWGGSGPWVPGSGSGSVYLGLDGQQFARVGSGSGAQREVLDVGEGVNLLSAQGIVTYGIAPRAEVEARLPYHFHHVNREDAALCAGLGEDGCAPTHTAGVIYSHLKVLVADEVSGAPVSVSVGALSRFGGLVHGTRHRLTNAGEGTIDGGGFVSVGRSGGLGKGYWTVFGDVGGQVRVPNTRSYPNQQGSRPVPGSELFGSLEALFAPQRRVSFGPAANLLWRPAGVDFAEIRLADPDRFGALRVTHVAAGAKLIFRDPHDNAFVFGLHRTVLAVNNPSDQFGISVGVALNRLFDAEGDD